MTPQVPTASELYEVQRWQPPGWMQQPGSPRLGLCMILLLTHRGEQEMFRPPFIIRLQRYDQQSMPHPPSRLAWLLIGPGIVLSCLALAILLWPELLAYMVAMLLLFVGLVLVVWGWSLYQAERHWR
jgi:uncharacterized membrane protein YphA (DoxX/SURF4 family)